jgi:hypothetical protein
MTVFMADGADADVVHPTSHPAGRLLTIAIPLTSESRGSGVAKFYRSSLLRSRLVYNS